MPKFLQVAEMQERDDGPLLLKPLNRQSVPKNPDSPSPMHSSRADAISPTPTLSPDPLLCDGMPLSKEILKESTAALKYIPLEEIDPYYYNKNTFVVTGSERIFRFSGQHALFCLSPFNACRRLCIHLLTHWLFSIFIVTVVLLNCFFVLINPSTNNSLFYISEYIFLSIYMLELTVKVMAKGLILDNFTCMRSPWNIFDLLIIICGILSLFFSLWIFQTISTLRILKIIPPIRDLKLRFEFVLETVKRLRSLIVLSCVLIFVFSTMGFLAFRGAHTHICYNETIENVDSDEILNEKKSNVGHYALESRLCGNISGARQCSTGFSCQTPKNFTLNPMTVYNSFDTFPQSVLQILRITMQDDEDNLFYDVWESTGACYLIYFAILFLGTTFSLKSYTVTIVLWEFIKQKNKSRSLEDKETFPETSASRVKCIERICGSVCGDVFQMIEKGAEQICGSCITELFLRVVIIADIVCMSLVHYGLNEKPLFSLILFYATKICFLAYFLEFILKIIAETPSKYFRNYWNIFDFSLVVLYAIDRILIRLKISENLFDGLLVLRMFKLGSRWFSMKLYFQVLFNVIKEYYTYYIFMLLAIYSVGVMEVFLYREDTFLSEKVYDHGSMWTFENFVPSSMISFRIVCGEWMENLWNCWKAQGKSCVFYFLVAVIVLNLIYTMLSVSIVFTTYQVLKQREDEALNICEISTPNYVLSLNKKICSAFRTVQIKIKEKFTGKRKQEGNSENVIESNARDHQEETRGTTHSTSNKLWEFKEVLKSVLENIIIKSISILSIVIASFSVITNEDYFQSPVVRLVFNIIEIFFTIYFLFSIIISSATVGFVRNCYSPSWIFDLVIILEMLLNLALLDFNVIPFCYGGVLYIRCLRPLMLISRCPRLKAVFMGICRQLSFLAKFLLVALFVWMYFAVLGVHLYNGTLFKCWLPDPEAWRVQYAKSGGSYSKQSCIERNYTYENPLGHFDNLAHGFISVALIVTRNGWTTVLTDILESHKANEDGPQIFTLKYNLYVMSVIIFGAFFICNVLFGAAAFHLKKNKESFMTSAQIESYKIRKSVEPAALIIETPTFGPFRMINGIVFASPFDALVMVVIFVDTLALAGSSPYKTQRFQDLMLIFYSVITLVYSIEMMLKLMAWRRIFFKSYLNVMDLSIVVASILGLAFTSDSSVWSPAIFRPLRLFRVFNFKPFIRRSLTISKFILGLSRSLPILLNLLLMLVLVSFTYTALGLSLFGNVTHFDVTDHANNFNSTTQAALTMFQLTKFSGWDTIFSLIGNSDHCGDQLLNFNSDCADFIKSVTFLFSYFFVVFIVVVNLYVVLVLEILCCFEDDKEMVTEAQNLNISPGPTNDYDLNPSCSVSARRKSAACFVLDENCGSKDCQVIILPSQTVQIVFNK